MAATTILNFTKGAISGTSKGCIVTIYLCTKFHENIFNGDRYGQYNKSKVAAAAFLNFSRSMIFGPSDFHTIHPHTKFDDLDLVENIDPRWRLPS